MNIDKQIKKIIFDSDELCISNYEDYIVSQIKQSILKAIIDRKPMGEWRPAFYKKYYNISKETESYASGYNQALKEFESVIKEVLK